MKRVRRSTRKNQLRTEVQQAMALDDGTLTTPAAVAVIQCRRKRLLTVELGRYLLACRALSGCSCCA